MRVIFVKITEVLVKTLDFLWEIKYNGYVNISDESEKQNVYYWR